MLKLLGATSPVVGTILDFLGVAGIIIFGSFLVIIVIDLILAATSDKEGLFFNKGKKEKNVSSDGVNVYTEPAPEENKLDEPVPDENGVVYFNTPNEDEKVSDIDFDKAVEEQQALSDKLQEPQTDFIDDEDEVEEEEDIEAIALEVANEALKQLNDDALVEEKKVFKVKEIEEEPVQEPVVEETVVEEVQEAPIIVEENSNEVNDEDLKRLEEQRQELERKVAELNAERAKDKEEFLKTLQELQDKEPVIIDNSKEEEEKRRLANITKMNSRLSRIKSSTKKIESKAKEEKVKPAVEVVEIEEPKKEEVVEEKHEKPRFKKEYYENRLEVLQQELKEVQAEFKLNKKDFVPLQKVYKTFEKDEAKLRRQEAIVAKQQISLHGVNKNKISDEKKAKLEENTKKLKELKESVYSCKQVIEQNKDRYPILEKNNKLLQKQINRLTEDIASVNEALKWYEENNQ